ncbi:hypothetical protein [Nocardioides sp. SYSU DS0663]|uniref:hypothetical protein n=1 Tax=Nocardioides sp. SYSU DS0663 TaxID=3416445 RepID=UPI003F4C1612
MIAAQAVDLGKVLAETFAWINLYVAFPVGVVGFAVAIWQVRLSLAASEKALTAAQSAERAAQRTATSIRRNLQTNQLHSLSETGTRLERELANLARAERPESQTIVDILRSWIDSGRRVSANLEAQDTQLRGTLDASVDACAKARNSYSRDSFEHATQLAWEALDLVEVVLSMASRVADDVIQIETSTRVALETQELNGAARQP